MKRPSFQFYPSDWLRDTALRTCSVGARGLWIDMICFMHEGTPYGHLKVNDKVILSDNLARMVGETIDTVEGYLRELSDAGVFEYDDDGAIFSRRMVKDEKVRNARADGGKKGGNPALINKKDNLTDNHKVYDEVKQKSTPSSSSSSSSSDINTSSEKPTKPATRLTSESVLTEDMITFCMEKQKETGVALNANKLFDEFKDYWIGVPGKNGTKQDWLATWRNHIRRYIDFQSKKTTKDKPTQGKSTEELERMILG